MDQNPTFPPFVCKSHPGYQPQRNLCSDPETAGRTACDTSCIATNCAVDNTIPTIAISSSDTDLASGETAIITFDLSEDVSDFVVGDITVTGGTLSDFTAVSASNYTAIYTANAPTGSVSVASGAFSDAAGNSNTDGADANNSVAQTQDSVPIPTLSEWAMILLMMLLGFVGYRKSLKMER